MQAKKPVSGLCLAIAFAALYVRFEHQKPEFSGLFWNDRRRKCQKCCEFCAKSQSLKIWFTFDLSSAADIPQSHLNLWNSSIQAMTQSRLIDFDLFFSGWVLHVSCGFSIGGISIIAKSTRFPYYSWVLFMKLAIPWRHFSVWWYCKLG